jgi:predicted glycogen debranching enzyme
MNPNDEWLETDRQGGYASGTVSGIRTRRYHALLVAAAAPPLRRTALVQGVEAWVGTPTGRFALSSHRYAPDVIHPDGATRLESFALEPWPTWNYRLEDGTAVRHQIMMRGGSPLVIASWKLSSRRDGWTLDVRPLLSGRDHHHLQHENATFRFDAEVSDGRVRWHPYAEVAAVIARANAHYQHAPEWYRRFLYVEEAERGLESIEDLASPGVFHFDLGRGEAFLVLAAERDDTRSMLSSDVARLVTRLRTGERRRRADPSALHRAADAYLVHGSRSTIVAGYPWFADWGRDTFIAMRGLCIASGRLDAARAILLDWSEHLSEGMLPNAFDEVTGTPAYASVDASLWFVIAVHELLDAMDAARHKHPARDRKRLLSTIQAILDGYTRGTRHGIRADSDGLLACGEPGLALTWMDARVDGEPVTPRIGKPVEVQALWLNALRIGVARVAWRPDLLARGFDAFPDRFWNDATHALHDVVDVDHVPGTADPTFRPNQIFAVGGLPWSSIEGERARLVVDAVEQRLWTRRGLRTLAADEPGYEPQYLGSERERDRAYHQGTVWPWLAGPFIEAWVRVRGEEKVPRRAARARFLAPLLQHLAEAGLGHVSEIADAEPPHAPRGCPFQAWSVGEVLRVDRTVLAEDGVPPVKLPAGEVSLIER